MKEHSSLANCLKAFGAKALLYVLFAKLAGNIYFSYTAIYFIFNQLFFTQNCCNLSPYEICFGYPKSFFNIPKLP